LTHTNKQEKIPKCKCGHSKSVHLPMEEDGRDYSCVLCLCGEFRYKPRRERHKKEPDAPFIVRWKL